MVAWFKLLTGAVFFIIFAMGLSVWMSAPDAILSASFFSLACLLVPRISRARTALHLRLQTPRDVKRKIPRHLRI
jgi:hypothetical protein